MRCEIFIEEYLIAVHYQFTIISIYNGRVRLYRVSIKNNCAHTHTHSKYKKKFYFRRNLNLDKCISGIISAQCVGKSSLAQFEYPDCVNSRLTSRCILKDDRAKVIPARELVAQAYILGSPEGFHIPHE